MMGNDDTLARRGRAATTGGRGLTPDDLANANLGLERSTAGLLGGVELLALGTIGVLQPAGVKHRHLVALLGAGAVALVDGGLGNTHGSGGGMEKRGGGAGLDCASEVGSGCSLEGSDEGGHGGAVGR